VATDISQKQNPERFKSVHYLVMPSTGGQTYVGLTGVVLATLRGTSEEQWREETFRIFVNLDKATKDAGFPPTFGFRARHWTAFATLSSIFNDEEANDAGWAVNEFRLEDPRTVRQAAHLIVDTAVRDTDGHIFRLGYNITMLGTFQQTPSVE
jgi:alpha-ketoglutarate-dependent taurine dioxygenase